MPQQERSEVRQARGKGENQSTQVRAEENNSRLRGLL